MSLLTKLRERQAHKVATATPPTSATQALFGGLSVASVATVAVADVLTQELTPPVPVAANDQVAPASAAAALLNPYLDLDRYCWPHSPAMNTREIDIFTARLARFTDKGAIYDDAERLADQLVIRDRESDDRRLCLECTHLHGSGRWRCGNWQRAGVALSAQDAQLPADLVRLLQRCDGFTNPISCQPQAGGTHGPTQAN